MKKSELLKALRDEILRHDLDTFMNVQRKVVEPGVRRAKSTLAPLSNLKDT
jgi:hypothetical protein